MVWTEVKDASTISANIVIVRFIWNNCIWPEPCAADRFCRFLQQNVPITSPLHFLLAVDLKLDVANITSSITWFESIQLWTTCCMGVEVLVGRIVFFYNALNTWLKSWFRDLKRQQWRSAICRWKDAGVMTAIVQIIYKGGTGDNKERAYWSGKSQRIYIHYNFLVAVFVNFHKV